MSVIRLRAEPSVPANTRETISTIRLRAAKHLKFFHTEAGALSAVEFEMAPSPTLLHPIYRALSVHRVLLADASARLTPHSVYQRFELREPSGAPLLGVRRREVEALFLEILASMRDA